MTSDCVTGIVLPRPQAGSGAAARAGCRRCGSAAQPNIKPLLSDGHFAVDGTRIEARASHRSFQPKDGSDDDGRDFHKQSRFIVKLLQLAATPTG
jgi:hypothetical protein